jgi:hypothetical protein
VAGSAAAQFSFKVEVFSSMAQPKLSKIISKQHPRTAKYKKPANDQEFDLLNEAQFKNTLSKIIERNSSFVRKIRPKSVKR